MHRHLKELAEILDSSWAREEAVPPYHIYLKMAYHLSQEARAGLSEFQRAQGFRNGASAISNGGSENRGALLNKRGGVMLGDVVGLGKTLMAAALARIFQEEPYFLEVLIICPEKPCANVERLRSPIPSGRQG